MDSTKPSRAWLLAHRYAERVLDPYNRLKANAIHITADGVEVYPRLLIPSTADLEANTHLWPYLTVTQAELYRNAVERLAEQHPRALEVVVSLLWGGLEGRTLKPAYTFRDKEKAV
ncbi:MAG: hypothetical protein SFU83_06405 [Meiothermus sp.]|nr:hypothetical protein [Meiothermus sp.]